MYVFVVVVVVVCAITCIVFMLARSDGQFPLLPQQKPESTPGQVPARVSPPKEMPHENSYVRGLDRLTRPNGCSLVINWETASTVFPLCSNPRATPYGPVPSGHVFLRLRLRLRLAYSGSSHQVDTRVPGPRMTIGGSQPHLPAVSHGPLSLRLLRFLLLTTEPAPGDLRPGHFHDRVFWAVCQAAGS